MSPTLAGSVVRDKVYTAVCINLAKFESPTENNACVRNKISSTQHRDLNFEHAHTSFVDHTKIARFTQTAVYISRGGTTGSKGQVISFFAADFRNDFQAFSWRFLNLATSIKWVRPPTLAH